MRGRPRVEGVVVQLERLLLMRRVGPQRGHVRAGAGEGVAATLLLLVLDVTARRRRRVLWLEAGQVARQGRGRGRRHRRQRRRRREERVELHVEVVEVLVGAELPLLHHVRHAQLGRAGLESPPRGRELGGVGVGAAESALLGGERERGRGRVVMMEVVALVALMKAVVHHPQLLGGRPPLQDHRKADLLLLLQVDGLGDRLRPEVQRIGRRVAPLRG